MPRVEHVPASRELCHWRREEKKTKGGEDPSKALLLLQAMISQLFVLSQRGDNIVFRDCEPCSSLRSPFHLLRSIRNSIGHDLLLLWFFFFFYGFVWGNLWFIVWILITMTLWFWCKLLLRFEFENWLQIVARCQREARRYSFGRWSFGKEMNLRRLPLSL